MTLCNLRRKEREWAHSGTLEVECYMKHTDSSWHNSLWEQGKRGRMATPGIAKDMTENRENRP
jgi:hypothetical protein